jgi:hypothetical protein
VMVRPNGSVIGYDSDAGKGDAVTVIKCLLA